MVYNPLDVLLFISKGHIYNNYWFSTATPGFLIKLLENQEFYAPELENLRASATLIDSYDIENIRIEPILFQSGYLTLQELVEKPRGGLEYRLRIPNREVQISFNDMLLDLLTGHAHGIPAHLDVLYEGFMNRDIEAMRTSLFSLYAGIPYNHFTNNPICRYEGYYGSVFYAAIASLGLKIIPEDITNRGRVDFTVFAGEFIYIIEFKVMDEDPLRQIKAQRYFFGRKFTLWLGRNTKGHINSLASGGIKVFNYPQGKPANNSGAGIGEIGGKALATRLRKGLFFWPFGRNLCEPFGLFGTG